METLKWLGVIGICGALWFIMESMDIRSILHLLTTVLIFALFALEIRISKVGRAVDAVLERDLRRDDQDD